VARESNSEPPSFSGIRSGHDLGATALKQGGDGGRGAQDVDDDADGLGSAETLAGKERDIDSHCCFTNLWPWVLCRPELVPVLCPQADWRLSIHPRRSKEQPFQMRAEQEFHPRCSPKN
jgi:hypothetical protein